MMLPVIILPLALFLLPISSSHIDPQGATSGSTISCPTEDTLWRLQTPYLWKWVGSYYNGTIDIDVKLDNTTSHCPLQTHLQNTTLPAILSLLSATQSSPSTILLNAWLPPATTPPNGTNLAFRQTPRDVVVDFSTTPFFRGHTNSAVESESGSCNVTVDAAGGVECLYGNRTNGDISALTMKFPSCNASQFADLVVQNVGGAGYGIKGALDGGGGSMMVVWEGKFLGELVPWGDYRVGIGAKGGFTGMYKITFRGVLDGLHSHKMVFGDGGVRWEQDVNKTREYGCVQKAGAKTTSIDTVWWTWAVIVGVGLAMW